MTYLDSLDYFMNICNIWLHQNLIFVEFSGLKVGNFSIYREVQSTGD